jgi:virginiamycin A acetyltransferase
MQSKARSRLRSLVRDSLVAVATLLVAPLWLLSRFEKWAWGGESLFTTGSELLSLVPGAPGIYLRRGYYLMTLEACATDCHLGFCTTVAHREVRIGRGVYVGSRCTLGSVVLEDHATVGSNVDILSGRHQHGFTDAGRSVQEQSGVFRRVRLGRHCWVGNSSVVMADVGDGCVVGAGTVVVKALPAGAVAVGNPACIKKVRPVSALDRPLARAG